MFLQIITWFNSAFTDPAPLGGLISLPLWVMKVSDYVGISFPKVEDELLSLVRLEVAYSFNGTLGIFL